MQTHLRNAFSKIIAVICVLSVFAFAAGFLIAPVNTVKWLGAPFMFLPSAVGLLPSVGPSDVQTVSLLQPSPKIAIARPGQYAVYTDEASVLMRANLMEASAATWIKLASSSAGDATSGDATSGDATSGDEAPGMNVGRGVLPYDPLAVPGRPIVTFAVDKPGIYTLVYPRQSGTLYFAPDITTGREATILLAIIGQISAVVIIGLGVFWPRIRRYRLQQRQFAAKLAEKRAHTEAFWQQRKEQNDNANSNETN